MKDKTIICLPRDVTQKQISRFKKALLKDKSDLLVVNRNCKVYHIKKGEIIEVVTKELKVKRTVKQILTELFNRIIKND